MAAGAEGAEEAATGCSANSWSMFSVPSGIVQTSALTPSAAIVPSDTVLAGIAIFVSLMTTVGTVT